MEERKKAVECRKVTKIYGSGATAVSALRGLDLNVFFGELLMLVGPSGCGKTTLLSVIAGILHFEQGTCHVLNNDLVTMSRRRLNTFRRQSIGFIFQSFNLIPSLTAIENVAAPLLIQRIAYKKAIKQAEALLGKASMENRSHALPHQLSGGEQQRVAICRALIHHPTLIVCDEPTSALDHETGMHIMELLREIAREPDRALVVVTHDPRIFDFADRIARMDDGQIVGVDG